MKDENTIYYIPDNRSMGDHHYSLSALPDSGTDNSNLLPGLR